MRAAIALLATLVVAGCGGGEEGPAPIEPLADYVRAGGIAGTYVEVKVNGSGQAVVLTGYPEQDQRKAEFTLRGSDLEELRDAVDSAQPLEVEETDTACADCFEYSLRVADDEIEFDSVDLDEGNVSPEVAELVAQLEDLAEEHGKPGP
jgi:hypothetical protein